MKIRASILNKTSKPENYSTALLDEFRSKETLNDHEKEQVIWATKALALRSYPKLKDWINLIIKHVLNGDEKLADGIGNIVRNRDEDAFLCYNEFAFKLARQKIFSLTKSRLIEGYSSSKSSIHLKALIIQLPHVPRFVLASEMAALLPILKNCLGSENHPELVLAALASVKDVLENDVQSFAQDLIPSLLPLWLEIASSNSTPMEVKIKALECIKIASKMETKDLMMHKKQVMSHLNVALDNKKRLVRKAAVEAKNAWCLST